MNKRANNNKLQWTCDGGEEEQGRIYPCESSERHKKRVEMIWELWVRRECTNYGN